MDDRLAEDDEPKPEQRHEREPDRWREPLTQPHVPLTGMACGGGGCPQRERTHSCGRNRLPPGTSVGFRLTDGRERPSTIDHGRKTRAAGAQNPGRALPGPGITIGRHVNDETGQQSSLLHQEGWFRCHGEPLAIVMVQQRLDWARRIKRCRRRFGLGYAAGKLLRTQKCALNPSTKLAPCPWSTASELHGSCQRNGAFDLPIRVDGGWSMSGAARPERNTGAPLFRSGLPGPGMAIGIERAGTFRLIASSLKLSRRQLRDRLKSNPGLQLTSSAGRH